MTTAGTSMPVPVFVTHHGIEYPGEMLRVPSWQPSLGAPLTDGAYFRVVFIETPSSAFPRVLRDHRIAVYVPGERSAAQDRAERELRIMREAIGTYTTDTESLDMLSDETEDVENWAVGAWAESFKNGRLIAAPSLNVELDTIFSGGYWTTWAEHIGRVLLERAYIASPIQDALLRIPLRPTADAPIIFDALTTGEGDGATLAVDTFGPALGITSTASPRTVDLAHNDILSRLTAMAAHGWPDDAIGFSLAHEAGLTYPLATLFLLLWILHGHHSAQLRPGHGLLQRDGQRFTGTTLTPSDIPTLRWPTSLWDRIESLSPDENSVGVEPYLAALAGPMGKDETPVSAAQHRLAELRDDLATIARTVRRIATAQHSSDPVPELDRLHDIAGTSSVEQAVQIASRAEPDPAGFAMTMDLWRGWSTACTYGDGFAHGIEWLSDVIIDEAARGMLAERTLLLERLRATRLLRAPHEWTSIVDSVRLFQERYSEAYLDHHKAYHAEMKLLADDVDSTWRKAQALARLNEISELGAPAGQALPALAEEMRNTVVACALERNPEDVMQAPMCPSCGIHLGAMPPASDVKQLVDLVNDALSTQNMRLSAVIGHRPVHHQDRYDINTFVNAVQGSDLTGLANVLDDEMEDFIRKLVRNDARA